MSSPSITNHFLVRSEHINADGNLFGGQLMAEIDSLAYCLLRTIYTGCAFVTRAADIQFVRPAPLGAVVNFHAERSRVGRSSVTVEVVGKVEGRVIAQATMTFVRFHDGAAVPVPRDDGTGKP